MKVGDGRNVSIWLDSWTTMGRLYDLFGAWECIDMVIPLKSTVAMAVPNQRRRRHRVDRFNEMETLIDDQRDKFQLWRINLWNYKEEKYKPVFSTKRTWENIRKHEDYVP